MILTGATFVYTRIQAMLWWVFHVSVMLFGVTWPLRYYSMRDSGRLRQTHLIMVTFGVLLPFIPTLICLWVGGYGFSVVYNYSCVPLNRDSVVYSFVGPMTVCSITATSMLVFLGFKLGTKVSEQNMTHMHGS